MFTWSRVRLTREKKVPERLIVLDQVSQDAQIPSSGRVPPALPRLDSALVDAHAFSQLTMR